MIPRPGHLAKVLRVLRGNRVVALLGALQVGKTTLAREIARRWNAPAHFFDLEDPRDLARLADPILALAKLRGLVVLDEIQRRPELFPVLRVIADQPRPPKLLVLGSASGDLLHQSSESLAGRIAYHELPPLGLPEVGVDALERLWVRGGMPRAFSARTLADSAQWRRDFVRTFLERDIPQLGVRVASGALLRFWTMLAHWHGQTMNWSELGRSMGVTDHTVRAYLELLEATFMVRLLAPWHQNVSKRQVKAPKAYLRDSGLLHTLLDIGDLRQLERHPKVGASWEGLCIDTIVQHLGARPEECFFWGLHSGPELDLLVVRGTQRRAFEIKRTASPALTASVGAALDSLRLKGVDVVHSGDRTFPLAPRVRALAFTDVLTRLAPLRP
jgi:predicted AAA+ superfamily ATPase